MDNQVQDHEYIKQNVHPIFERIVVELLTDKPPDPVVYILDWLKDKGKTLYKLPPRESLLASQKENRNYINTKIHPIFERLIIDLLLNKPDNVLDFMLDWFLNKGSQFCLALENAFQENKPLDKIMVKKKPKNEDQISSDESQDDEEIVDELPLQTIQQKYGNPRFAVSAEVGNEVSIVEEIQVFKKKQDDWVIKQGDEGYDLFIIDSGELDCFKQMSKNDQKFLRTFMPGESFGELALLYNTPRSISIRAKTDCVVWTLSRYTFNNVINEATINKRAKYEKFLQSIELLKEIDVYERSKIADALKIAKYKKGEYVVRQGDEGNMFFMIEEGELVALKVNQPGAEPNEVMQYKPGMYFGELALMKDQPRQASILCKTDCTLACLDRYSFKRLIGPLDNILKRNMENYNKYNK